MGDVVVVEASEHMYDCISLAYVGKEFVAQALAFRRAFDQAGNINNLYSGGHDRFGLAHFHKLCQAVVGYGDYAHVGFDSAEGKVGRLGLGVRQAIEQC